MSGQPTWREARDRWALEHAETELTLDQARALQTGDQVTVIWCGGNGPHSYMLNREPSGHILAMSKIVNDLVVGLLLNASDDRQVRLLHRIWLEKAPLSFETPPAQQGSEP